MKITKTCKEHMKFLPRLECLKQEGLMRPKVFCLNGHRDQISYKDSEWSHVRNYIIRRDKNESY